VLAVSKALPDDLDDVQDAPHFALELVSCQKAL
jgi:hypothetical protein